MIRKRLRTIFASEFFCLHKIYTIKPYNIMRKVILLTAMPKEGVWSSSIYVNGGSKVTFCVKHNLISTFFNFVFYCTLVFIMCFLTAGNICAQTPLPLYVNNGTSSNPNYVIYGENYEFTIEENGTKVMLKDDGTIYNDNKTRGDYIGFSYVGGVNWAKKPFTSGETHTFTVTLNPYSKTWRNQPVVGELHIAALKCEITNANHQQSLTGQIVAEASIVLPEESTESRVLTLEVNSSYEAVYLYKKNRTVDWEYVDIASVTRTVSETKPINISESANNSITVQTGATVNLTRSLVKGMWNTICLPFAPTSTQADAIFGKDAKFAEFTSVSNGVMQFTSVAGSLVAGKPYLVLPTRDDDASSPIVLTGVNIPPSARNAGEVTIEGYTFKGIYSPTPFAKDDWYKIRFVAAGNKLKYPNTENPNNTNESTPLKALRAYFILPSASPAKDYFYDVDSFVPTSIANIQIEGDGDGAIYNIGGQRVEGKSLPKGIYIRDGKKFVVK